MNELVYALLLSAVFAGTPAFGKASDDFSRYPARVTKVHARPVFDDSSRLFRTVIREGMSQGINFAGHLTFVEVSCGMGCMREWVVDRRTGAVVELPISDSGPLGDQEFYYPVFDVRPNSRLLKAEWTVSAYGDGKKGCMRQDFLWEQNDFRELGPPRKMACKLDERS